MKTSSIVCTICLLLCTLLMLSSCHASNTVGIANAAVNEKGELILVYTDGTEQNVGVVVGKDGTNGQNGKDGIDGQNGAPGKDGADGQNGKDGVNGQDGADGSLTITTNGSSIPAASSKGLRSAVSIVCNFQATVQAGGWYPGAGSTTTKEYSSAGSGVIYKMDKAEGDAFIITNYHVVYDVNSDTANGISEDISVYLYGSHISGKAIKASYVGGSLYYDIAVLRIEDSEILKNSNACEVQIADSDRVIVGDSAIAIGNAQGLGISATSGIVSVDSEHITMTAADEKTEVSFRVMRVDAAVNSGNSGGGLYDDEGNLIGIVNAKIIYAGVENIGYAIPSNVAVAIADNILDYCYGTDEERVQRALLGISVITSDSRAVYDPDPGRIFIEETVTVHTVNDGALAQGVLQAEDTVLRAELNGVTTEITRQHHLIDMMLRVRVGDVVTLHILRDGEEMSVCLTITQECLAEY